MRSSLSLLALSAGTAFASYAGNLNYRSPSHHHPALGISVHKIAKRSDPLSSFDPAQLNFTHGVASGDPYATSVILWTRCSPMFDDVDDNSTVTGLVPLFNPVPIYKDTDEHRPMSNAPVCLKFIVAADKNMRRVVDKGTVYTSSDVDYTVKPCWPNKDRPEGIPVSQSYQFGRVFVQQLPDYIYEYAEGEYGSGKDIGRISLPNRQIYTLYDYRKRIATYRTDLDLQASHQSFPWIPVWDDHDNAYRDGSSKLNNTEASFISDGGVSVDQRKMNAVRAYFEWMPIRQVEMDDNLRIWRNFQLGSLVDVIMLDTRNYDRSITDLYWNKNYVKQLQNEASHSLMGSRQENWFYRNLIKSSKRGAKWRVIGSQIVWLGHEKYDSNTGSGAIGVEFGGSAVTSPSPAGHKITIKDSVNASKALVTSNPQLQWSELYYRGYFELHITPKEVQSRFFGIPKLRTRDFGEISLANFTIKSGANHLDRGRQGVPAGGVVENGWLKGGKVVQTNATRDTETGKWYVSN
ncbi:conserved hypothetical protein [Uncinocarpus reesii 1704]|uniref:PhoD-like phosphatase metallophosphatase domain-containing protein n=1 Tax=Uncinocarpus reesii (strain UAMH 1704) TaxID=336963 RepID=C4JYL5_UNCRE|nr:uncharacterized protein UREG_07266 [Uncinocarpus reesii 1704]EEP82401.1 conserved hypothetical protein [Uncinocarpus reesii 1704]